ncbi:MAG: glycoside hydrolase family 38 C-terminal domain-containing protein [Ignavibacteriales bacterium]
MNEILNPKGDITAVAPVTTTTNRGTEPIIYLVPHTHYDAIWVFNKEDYFHINIEFILKKAVELMKANSEYKFTIEQTYLLEQVEENYPSLFADITRLTKEKRIEIAGGQYLMSDVMLPHGETLIREILKGKRYIKEKFDQDVIVGWGTDEFGFNAQWPQILLGCGYKYFAFRRGTDQSKPSEFWWEGLDGSRILSHWMPLGYRAGLELTQLQKSYKELRKLAATHHIFMPSGSGVTLPQPETVDTVKKWNASIGIDDTTHHYDFMVTSSSVSDTDTSAMVHDNTKKPRILRSTPSEFFSNLERDQNESNLVTRKGEMYSGRFSEVFPDCTSSRMWIKQGVKEYENLLLTLERWHALSELEGVDHDVFDRLKKYWNRLLFMSMHDALPGTGIDEVYNEIRQSFRSDFGPIRKLTIHCLLNLLSRFCKGSDQDLVVFNSHTWKVKDWVECVLEFDEGKIRGISNLTSSSSFNSSIDAKSQKVRNKDKDSINEEKDRIDIEIIECSPYPDGSIQVVKIGFIAEIPALGFKLYQIVPGENTPSERILSHSTTFKNGSNFDISIDPENGLLSVSKDGKDYFKGNEILLEEELGDLYYHKDNLGLLKSETGEGVKYGSFKCDSFGVLEGKLTYHITLKSKYYALRWPYRLTHKLKPILYRHNFVDIVKEIIVYKSLDRIDFVTHIFDRHPHSRLRVRFRTPCSSDDYWCGTQFGAIRRKTNLYYNKNESGWIERPSGVFPSLDWIDYSGNEEEKECAKIGISVMHRGIPSHEVRDNSIYLTLLRSIMVLSADGIMGPCVPTPDAAEMIPYTFSYSVLPHEESWRESGTYKRAMEFNMPLAAIHLGGSEVSQRAIRENIIDNDVSNDRLQSYQHSFLEVQPRNVMLSTLKLDERDYDYDNNRSLIVRIYETEGRSTDNASLIFYRQIKSASIIDLLENEIQEIPIHGTHPESQDNNADDRYDDVRIEGNIIRMDIGAFKIVSLKINF